MNNDQSHGKSSVYKRSDQVTERIFALFSAHPYIFAFFVCMVSSLLFFGAADNMASYAPAVIGIVSCAAASLAVTHICNVHRIRFSFSLIAAAGASALCLGAAWQLKHTRYKMIFLLCFGCIFLLLFYFSFFRKKLRRQFNSFLIMGTGFMVKLGYVLCTSVYQRQHDIGWFGGEEEIAEGHMGYISYLFHNHHLYNGDYRCYLQYCHPPLHHAVCALWIKLLNGVFHVELGKAVESAQFLPLFYSMAIIIAAYKIFRYFALDGSALYIPLLITSFHPCFIFLSSLMNNDALAWALTMGAVLCTLRWYREPTLRNILKIALCMGLGMMTKISAALAAPPIAMIFLTVFLRGRKTVWKKLIGQFAAFLGVCAPLGLWFPLRGLIRWGIPLTYVQELPEMDQSIKGITFWERITDFSPVQFRRVFINWLWYDETGAPQSFNEHNPLIAILKNSIFSEFIGFDSGCFMEYFCKVLFWLAAALAAAAFAAMLIGVFRRGREDKVQKLFLVFFHIFLLCNLYYLSREYPMVCSMNFRYLMPTVITGALFLGMAVISGEKTGKVSVKVLKLSLTAAAMAFAVMSSVVYIVAALGI